MNEFQENRPFFLPSFLLLFSLSLLITLSCNILKADDKIQFYIKGDASQTIVIRHGEESEYAPLKLKEFKDLCFGQSHDTVKHFSQLWKDIISDSDKSELIQRNAPVENCKIMIFEIERKLKDLYGMNKQEVDDYHISIDV